MPPRLHLCAKHQTYWGFQGLGSDLWLGGCLDISRCFALSKAHMPPVLQAQSQNFRPGEWFQARRSELFGFENALCFTRFSQNRNNNKKRLELPKKASRPMEPRIRDLNGLVILRSLHVLHLPASGLCARAGFKCTCVLHIQALVHYEMLTELV